MSSDDRRIRSTIDYVAERANREEHWIFRWNIQEHRAADLVVTFLDSALCCFGPYYGSVERVTLDLSKELNGCATDAAFPTMTRLEWDTIVRGISIPLQKFGIDAYRTSRFGDLRSAATVIEELCDRLGRAEIDCGSLVRCGGFPFLITGYESLTMLRESIRRLEPARPLIMESHADWERWHAFRNTLVNENGRILPLLAAMRIKGEGDFSLLPTLACRDLNDRMRIHDRNQQTAATKRCLSEMQQSTIRCGSRALPKMKSEEATAARAALQAPLVRILETDPAEHGWKRWWEELVTLRSALERIREAEA